jgi:hypothetical protein
MKREPDPDAADVPAGHFLGPDGIVRKRRLRAPRDVPRHRLITVKQAEEKHPGFEGRLRSWIHRADCGDPEFAGLRLAIVRIGRSLFLSDDFLNLFIEDRRGGGTPAPARSPGRVTQPYPDDRTRTPRSKGKARVAEGK